MEKGRVNYIKLLKNKPKNTLIQAAYRTFQGKKDIIRNNNQRQERKQTISRGRDGSPKRLEEKAEFCCPHNVFFSIIHPQ
jgi:hypothetical protein